MGSEEFCRLFEELAQEYAERSFADYASGEFEEAGGMDDETGEKDWD